MSVKFAEVFVPVRVATTKKIVFEDGERSCAVVDTEGMPLFHPNLFLTTQVRNGSLSSSTLSNNAGHLCAFLQSIEESHIDLIARLSAGDVLQPFEVEALRGDLQRRLSHKPEGRGFHSYLSQTEYVSKEITHARITVSTKYLDWLATLYLRNPRDPDELERVLAAMREMRPINKKRNTIKRKRGLSAENAFAIKEVLRPGSQYNIWSDPAIQVRNRLILSLLYEAGIRRGELLNLMIEDFNFGANSLEIVRRADEKADPRVDQPLVKTNDRVIPIKAALMAEVRLYISDHRRHVPGAKKHGFLFVTHKLGPTVGQPMTIPNYKHVVSTLRAAVPPLKYFSGHDLRHYWNERFSDLMDKTELSPVEQEQIRSQLMGWKFGSGTAATYNQRFVEKKAAEFGMKLQASFIGSKGVQA
jgi:integrase